MIDTAYLVLIAVGVGVGVGVIMGFIYRSSLKPRQLDIEKEKIKLFEEAKKKRRPEKRRRLLRQRTLSIRLRRRQRKT